MYGFFLSNGDPGQRRFDVNIRFVLQFVSQTFKKCFDIESKSYALYS